MKQSDPHEKPSILEDDDPGLDLQRYMRVVRKHLWVIAAVVAVGLTATVLYTMRQPKIYQARAAVVIDPHAPNMYGSKMQEVIQLGAGNYWSNQEYYNTQVDILASYKLAKMTVERNQLHLDPRLVPHVENDTRTKDELIEAAAAALKRSISAKQRRDSRIVNIYVNHTNPDFAVKLANMHVDTYVEYVRSLRTTGKAEVAAQDLARELDAASKQLAATEKELLKFKQDNKLISTSLEEKQNMVMREIVNYSTAHASARVKRLEIEATRARARRLRNTDVLESPIFGLTTPSALVETLKDQYTRAKHKMDEKALELGPRHPEYLRQKKEVDGLYAALQREAKRAVRELDERYYAALATEKKYEKEVERLKKEALALEPLNAKYTTLKRQQKQDEANYTLMLERSRASDMSKRNRTTNITEHGKARHAYLVHPRMKLNVAVGLLLSLMLGIGLAFMLEYVDRTIKAAEDVDRVVGAPLLGVIPLVGDFGAGIDGMRDRDLYVSNNPSSAAAECCRSIRTNILFSTADRPMSTLTISSPKPREGKTTTTIYLGTTMAQSGQRVLIVDTDMRRPRLHKSMGVSRERGLTNLILGDAAVEDCIKTTDIPNLYVLPCGPQPPNPAELLLTNRFKEVMADLESRYDRILLDSPPLLAVTDAVVLARLSDGVVMVAQAGKTLIDDAAQATRQLKDVDAAILGVILNDIDLHDRKYGYYYSAYRYGDDEAPLLDGTAEPEGA